MRTKKKKKAPCEIMDISEMMNSLNTSDPPEHAVSWIHCNLAKINIKPHLLQAHSPRCPAGFGPLPESVVLSTG